MDGVEFKNALTPKPAEGVEYGHNHCKNCGGNGYIQNTGTEQCPKCKGLGLTPASGHAPIADLDIEALKNEADQAYCRALDISGKSCLGAEYKIENKTFTLEQLKAHEQHSERLGYHFGMYRVIKEILASRRLIGRVPDGYKIVPIEPTEDMLKAAWKDQYKFRGGEEDVCEALASGRIADQEQRLQDISAYRAMLNAAPDDGGE